MLNFVILNSVCLPCSKWSFGLKPLFPALTKWVSKYPVFASTEATSTSLHLEHRHIFRNWISLLKCVSCQYCTDTRAAVRRFSRLPTVLLCFLYTHSLWVRPEFWVAAGFSIRQHRGLPDNWARGDFILYCRLLHGTAWLYRYLDTVDMCARWLRSAARHRALCGDTFLPLCGPVTGVTSVTTLQYSDHSQ